VGADLQIRGLRLPSYVASPTTSNNWISSAPMGDNFKNVKVVYLQITKH